MLETKEMHHCVRGITPASPQPYLQELAISASPEAFISFPEQSLKQLGWLNWAQYFWWGHITVKVSEHLIVWHPISQYANLLNAKLSPHHPNTNFQDLKNAILGQSPTLRMQFSFQPCLGDSVADTQDLQQVTKIIFSLPIAEISLISVGWLLFKIFFCGDRVNQSSRWFFQKHVTF